MRQNVLYKVSQIVLDFIQGAFNTLAKNTNKKLDTEEPKINRNYSIHVK